MPDRVTGRAWRSALPATTAGLVILIAWAVLAHRMRNTTLLPSPLAVAETLVRLIGSGTIFRHTGTSLGRIFLSWSLAAAVAIPLGIAMGRSERSGPLRAPLRRAFPPHLAHRLDPARHPLVRHRPLGEGVHHLHRQLLSRPPEHHRRREGGAADSDHGREDIRLLSGPAHHPGFPWLNVRDNIEFPMRVRGWPAERRRVQVEKFMELVHLGPWAGKKPSQLSGGMKPRVGIARALALDPELLLMDEPFGALDAQTRSVMQEELLNIWRREAKTVLFVTHSIPEAIFLAERIVVMTSHPGRVKAVIDVAEPRPRDVTSAEFNRVQRNVMELLRPEIRRAGSEMERR